MPHTQRRKTVRQASPPGAGPNTCATSGSGLPAHGVTEGAANDEDDEQDDGMCGVIMTAVFQHHRVGIACYDQATDAVCSAHPACSSGSHANFAHPNPRP